MKPFFIQILKLLGLGRQIWQINSTAFEVFSAELNISTHLGTVSPLSMFSIIQPLFLQKYLSAIILYSCRLYCWKFWYCHNLGTNLAAVINLLFHSGISSLLRFWSGHIYSIDTIWRNSLRLLSYHDKMLAIQRIIQRFQCTT